MLAEFSIYPLGGTRHLSKDIAQVVQTLGETGLHFELGPLSTAVGFAALQVLSQGPFVGVKALFVSRQFLACFGNSFCKLVVRLLKPGKIRKPRIVLVVPYR